MPFSTPYAHTELAAFNIDRRFKTRALTTTNICCANKSNKGNNLLGYMPLRVRFPSMSQTFCERRSIAVLLKEIASCLFSVEEVRTLEMRVEFFNA